jgi:quercetin dioxygenase-like cupin family protein
MGGFKQLNVYGMINRQSTSPQHIHLFTHEELKAELLVLPPGTSGEWHTHTHCDELFDVLEGQGTFLVEDRVFNGSPGKSVLVEAGVRHQLCNNGDVTWVVRVTCHERLYPRRVKKLVGRSIRRRLGIE